MYKFTIILETVACTAIPGVSLQEIPDKKGTEPAGGSPLTGVLLTGSPHPAASPRSPSGLCWLSCCHARVFPACRNPGSDYAGRKNSCNRYDALCYGYHFFIDFLRGISCRPGTGWPSAAYIVRSRDRFRIPGPRIKKEPRGYPDEHRGSPFLLREHQVRSTIPGRQPEKRGLFPAP